MTALRWFFFLWCCGYLLCAGCAHRYTKSENRYLEASENIKWDSAEEKHDEQRQQRDVTKKDNTVTVRRKTTPSPQGPIVEEEYVLTLSELRDTSGVVTASSSKLATAGEEQRKKKAENQLNVQADTKVGLPWFRIGLGVVVAALLAFCYFRFRPKWIAWFRRRLHI